MSTPTTSDVVGTPLDRVGLKAGAPAPSLADALGVLERSVRDAAGGRPSGAATGTGAGPMALYRALVAVLARSPA